MENKIIADLKKFEKSKVYAEKYNLMIMILTGRTIDNPISQDELGKRIATSSRNIRLLINHARKKGVPIASGDTGLFMARDFNELKATIDRIESHAKTELYTVSQIKKTFSMQTSLF